ncbi:MAG: TIGR02186 family protein [Xanthobacteraceae bacterium]|uniref:TIGR02186 family protein n=1 Tax=Pseudolabrys sp. TaxID=1960880 RepID=UPI003D0B0D0B
MTRGAKRAAAWLTALAVAGFMVAPAFAERLVVSLSTHRVTIAANFVGEDLVLFGTIEPDPAGQQLRSIYDLVVTVAGPKKDFRTRRKERVLGIWVNVDAREFVRVPSYLAVLSNRPAKEIAGPDVARRLQLGLDNYILTQRIGPDFADTVRDDPFRTAFIKLEQEHGMYYEKPTSVTYLTPTVFRATIPLPSNAPIGTYNVDVKLLGGGELLTRTTTALEITKVGIEQFVADAARDYGFFYGLATAFLALLTGWFASVVFRRD